jgi:hypothetical protein
MVVQGLPWADDNNGEEISEIWRFATILFKVFKLLMQ